MAAPYYTNGRFKYRQPGNDVEYFDDPNSVFTIESWDGRLHWQTVNVEANNTGAEIPFTLAWFLDGTQYSSGSVNVVNGATVGSPATDHSDSASGLPGWTTMDDAKLNRLGFTVRDGSGNLHLSWGDTDYAYTPPAPTAPIGLTATTDRVREIVLDWDGADGTYVGEDIDTGYEVFRDTVKVFEGISSQFTDSGVGDGASHSYTVTTFRHDTATDGTRTRVTSDPSAAVTGQTIPMPLAPVLSGTAGNKENSLSWTDPGGTKDGYRLYRDGALVYQGTALAVTDPVALNDVTYRYVVAAYTAAGEARSNEVALTPTFQTGPPVTATVAFSPYLRDVWMRHILARTTHVRASNGSAVTATLELNSGVLTNPDPINLGVSGEVTVQGLASDGTVLWIGNVAAATAAGVIPANELAVLLET